ncbi:MAG: hypothetical protein VB050_09075 [Geobacteraceae bacterium]|nr:hypothetical protein [Geobacteraceae bacterium]
MAMKAAWLLAESFTVMWFVAVALLTQVFGFSSTDSEMFATEGITSGIAGGEKRLQAVIKPVNDNNSLEPAGFDSSVFSDEQKLMPASPENINFTGGLDDQNWLIRNDLCPIFDRTDFPRQEKILLPLSH